MFKQILGAGLIIGGIILGLWLGLWVMFVGGLIQFVQSIIVLSAKGIVFGFVKVWLAALVGWLSAILCIIPGVALLSD